MQLDSYRIAFGFLIVFLISLLQLVYVYDRINRSVDSKIQELTHQNQIIIQQTNHIMVSKIQDLTDSLKRSELSNAITNSEVADLTEALKKSELSNNAINLKVAGLTEALQSSKDSNNAMSSKIQQLTDTLQKSESEVTRLKEIVDKSDISNPIHLIKMSEFEVEVEQLKNFVNEMCEQQQQPQTQQSSSSFVETYMKLPTVQDALAKGSRATRFVHHTELVNSLKQAAQASYGGSWDRYPKFSGKTAVILLTNFIWIEFLENLVIALERAESPLVNSFVVIALDTETVEWVKNFRVKLNVVDFSGLFTKANEDNQYMTDGFIELCFIKAEVIISALINGVNIFIFDSDISFNIDPLLRMDLNFDFTGFCLQNPSLEMNYGMMWVRGSDKTVGVFADMYKRIEDQKLNGNKVTNDQFILRDVYNEPARGIVRNCLDASFDGENCAEYAGFRLATAFYFHGTCTTGTDKKKAYLKKVNAWFLDS